MLTLPPSVKVYVATQAVDGRKGAYSLAAMVRSVFAHDPLSGDLYVFFSRRLDRVRVLYWDRSGFALWSKRLEMGRFRAAMSTDGTFVASQVEYAELMLVLEGIELSGARRRPRWAPRKVADVALAKVLARAS